MFLWTRLVLDYIFRSMICDKREVLTAIDTLPEELSKL